MKTEKEAGGGTKHRPRHEQGDIYELILGDGALQSVPHAHISSHPSSPVDTATFTHQLYQAHRASSSNGIQVWRIKPSALVDSNINCPQKYLRVWMRAWEMGAGGAPALHGLQTRPGEVLRWKFHLCYPWVHTCFFSSFPSLAVATTASCPTPATITKSGKQWSRQRGGSSSGGEVRETSSDVFARPLMVSRPQREEPGKTAHSSKKLMQLPSWK